MDITVELLRKHGACPEAVEWLRAQKTTDHEKLLSLAIRDGKYHWANWLTVRLLNRNQKIQYAVFAAEQVLDIFEKRYPEDKRPRKAIESAKKVAEDDSEENRRDSNVAANASYAAALAAHVALADSNVA